ncbi:hypothetical protein V8B97DRAFT_1949545 [Scleroderma yunnanense]
MPKKTTAHGHSRTLKQRTLTGFLQSSPPAESRGKSTHKTPSKQRRRAKIPSPEESAQSGDEGNGDSDVGVIRFEAETIEISDEDASPRRPKRRRTNDIFREREPEDDEELIGIPVRWKGKGKMKAIVDSDDESQPRRKLVKGARPLTPEDDEDDVDETQILESRLRARGRQTKYQKDLQKLKNLQSRKRGQILVQSSEELSEKDGSDDSEGVDDDRSNTSDSDNSDFIIEDNVEDANPVNLPVAFSMNTHQDLAHHFKVICQLFVHMAVRPLPERRPFMEHVLKREEYFSVPLQVTRRKLFGMRDSLVISSIWGPEFKKTLEKYPEFTLIRMKFGVSGCDACRLPSRTSTLLGRVDGTPYDNYDFEDLTDDESDDSEPDASVEDSDRGPSKKRKKEFHLGRFCAARTRVYHEFNHWEYSLYKTLQREIMEAHDDDNAFVKVAYLGGALPPQDMQNADKIMDWLDQRRIIEMEWQKVRSMMDSARKLESSSRWGDADDIEDSIAL